MDEKIISFLRGVRTVLQTAVEPIDWASRMLNNKHGYPSLKLRQSVGDLSDFEGSGGEYLAYLRLLCGLKPGDELLDIGCGCGLMCLPLSGSSPLPKYLKSYCGCDINKRVINWCEKNIKTKYKNCYFAHLTSNHLPYASNSFDVILAKSLFTHLLREETENYLEEIKRLLKPGGKCLATFFLFGDEEPEGKYTFQYPKWPVCYERLTKPRLAVAYDEDWVTKLLKKKGFSLGIYYGTWTGRQDGLSYQDIIVMRRQ